MLEKNLEECLNNAFKFAHENNHEFVTTEHLLLCVLTVSYTHLTLPTTVFV